jgi:hypothetical protein
VCSAPGLNWPQTSVSECQFLFAWLPPKEPPYASAWGRNLWGIHNGTEYVAFHTVNLIRKYGADWQQWTLERTRQRLRV